MKRYRLNRHWSEEMLKARPILREIADSWRSLDNSTDRCDRGKAETAVKRLYHRAGLAPPTIKWWSSPIAMILAHEIHCQGMINARAYYKDAVFSVSPELDDWLSDPKNPRQILGRPIGKYSCNCRTPGSTQEKHFNKKLLLRNQTKIREAELPTIERGAWPTIRNMVLRAGRTSAFNCQKHIKMMSSVIMNDADMLRTTQFPCGAFYSNSIIEQGVFGAFMHDLEDLGMSEEDSAKWWSPPVLTKNTTLFSSDIATNLLKWQFAAALVNKSLDDSCLFPYIDLVQNSHVAIIRENICWLADRPTAVKYNNEGSLHAERSPALCYADDTKLYFNNGLLLPAKWINAPEHISLDLIDGDSTPHFRRVSLIELFGIENYLITRDAIKVEENNNGILWKLMAGDQGLIRIIETPDYDCNNQLTGKEFRQLPGNILTLWQALDYVEIRNSSNICTDELIITVKTSKLIRSERPLVY